MSLQPIEYIAAGARPPAKGWAIGPHTGTECSYVHCKWAVLFHDGATIGTYATGRIARELAEANPNGPQVAGK